MSRIYAVKWSARTRGARWKTVTGETRITASGIHVAASRVMKMAEREARAKIGAVTLHLEEIGTAGKLKRDETRRSTPDEIATRIEIDRLKAQTPAP